MDGQTNGVQERNMEAAIGALLAHNTLEEAANALGVTSRTLRNWLSDPSFQEAYRKARAELLERVVGRLLSLCGRAVATLEKNLGNASGAISNRAAELLLTHAVRSVEQLDLAERIAALEARQVTDKKGVRR